MEDAIKRKLPVTQIIKGWSKERKWFVSEARDVRLLVVVGVWAMVRRFDSPLAAPYVVNIRELAMQIQLKP